MVSTTQVSANRNNNRGDVVTRDFSRCADMVIKIQKCVKFLNFFHLFWREGGGGNFEISTFVIFHKFCDTFCLYKKSWPHKLSKTAFTEFWLLQFICFLIQNLNLLF